LVGDLDAGRAGTDNGKCRPPSLFGRVGAFGGPFVGAQDLVAQADRFGEGLHRVQVLGPVVVAEVAVLRAGGHHEIVVADTRGRTAGLEHLDVLAGEVDVGGLGEQHGGVALPHPRASAGVGLLGPR